MFLNLTIFIFHLSLKREKIYSIYIFLYLLHTCIHFRFIFNLIVCVCVYVCSVEECHVQRQIANYRFIFSCVILDKQQCTYISDNIMLKCGLLSTYVFHVTVLSMLESSKHILYEIHLLSFNSPYIMYDTIVNNTD